MYRPCSIRNGVSVLFLYQREATDTSNDSHLVVCKRNLAAATILPDWVAYRYLQPRCLSLGFSLSLVLALALALVAEAGVEGETSLALALVTEGGNGPGRSQQQHHRQLRPLPR